MQQEDIALLKRDKYGNNDADMSLDIQRLQQGEPLAYVIGWIPFLGLHIDLSSRPLIPRPETEWWVEELIKTVKPQDNVLDLCAGSGAIGLSILKYTEASVSFGELIPSHIETIQKNIEINGLPKSRVQVRAGDLFAPFHNQKFSIIATNPPYIPSTRELPESVSFFEPKEALYAGIHGTEVIERIIKETPEHIELGGTLWMECDIDNVEYAKKLALETAVSAEIRTDLYGRPRLLVAYY